MAGVTLKCKDCNREIEIGTDMPNDCDNCLRIALAMQKVEIDHWTPTRLAHWAAKHCQELGIITV